MISNQGIKTRICPQCGDVVSSFTGICPSCGTEFFDIKSSELLIQFSKSVSEATTLEQKTEIIRTFPVPNTKEDIIEFMIIASSNIGYSNDCSSAAKTYEAAWITKFMQANQKAKIMLDGDDSYEKSQKIYMETMARIEALESEQTQKKIINEMLKNLPVAIGIVVALIAVWMDMTGENSSLMELIATIVMILAVVTMKKRNADFLDYGIAVIGGLALIVLSFVLSNGVVFELGGAITLIVVAVNFFKGLGK